MLLSGVVGFQANRIFERREVLATIVSGDPEASFAALARLTGQLVDADELLERVRQREKSFDVLERGLGGVEEDRGPALLRVAELLLPLVAEDPEDPA